MILNIDQQKTVVEWFEAQTELLLPNDNVGVWVSDRNYTSWTSGYGKNKKVLNKINRLLNTLNVKYDDLSSVHLDTVEFENSELEKIFGLIV